jgi:branched-chain amino acid transport system substrate-binding protein
MAPTTQHTELALKASTRSNTEENAMKRTALLYAAAVLTFSMPPGFAAENPVRIAIVNDKSGPFSDYGGEGSVIAARLAVEDFGGRALGNAIEILSIDHQNKTEIASARVRQLIENEGVDAIADGAASSAAIAIQNVTREREKIFLITGATTVELTGKECSPTGFHFSPDTYAMANATAKAMLEAGGKTWYFITADYAFGTSLELQAKSVVEASGGKVVGATRHPLNTQDLSSFLLQAQSSNADVVGLANAGSDLVNAIKQAQEFGLTGGKQKVVGFLLDVIDVNALGLPASQGLQFVDPFYWDLSDETRAWAKRFMEKSGGKVPSQIQAGTYTAVLHYLKAVEAAGTKEGKAVAQKMRETPITDMYHEGTKIREDGRVLGDLHLMEVKKPSESKYAFDYLRPVGKISGEQSYRPLNEGGCSYITN